MVEGAAVDIIAVEGSDIVANLHAVPFPLNPLLQVHEYEPILLVHVALMWHP